MSTVGAPTSASPGRAGRSTSSVPRTRATSTLGRRSRADVGDRVAAAPRGMPSFTTLKGKAAALDLQNIDTDMIIPKQFLKTIKRTGLGVSAFYEMRYNEDGSERDDFCRAVKPPRTGTPTILVRPTTSAAAPLASTRRGPSTTSASAASSPPPSPTSSSTTASRTASPPSRSPRRAPMETSDAGGALRWTSSKRDQASRRRRRSSPIPSDGASSGRRAG